MKLKSKESVLIFLLAAIQFAHVLDFVVLMPLGPMLMRTLNIGPTKFALLVSAYNVSAGIAGTLYSIIADRYDRKVSLELCFLGFILGTLLCGLTDSFYLLLSARVIAGAFGGILTGVVFAIISDLIPFERRGKALSVVMSAFSVASVIGVPIGLIVAERVGWQGTFIFIALLSVLILLASRLIVPSVSTHITKGSMKQNIKRLRSLVANSRYAKCYLLVFINIMSIFMVIPFIAPFAIKNVGLLETDLKYVYAVGGICTVIAARLIGVYTDKLSPLKMMTILIPISAVPIYFMTHLQASTLTFYLLFSSLFMMFVSGRMIPLMTMISEISTIEDRGSFMGIINAVRSLGTSIAAFLAGLYIYESNGELQNYDNIGVISILIGFVTLAYAFKVNRLLQGNREAL